MRNTLKKWLSASTLVALVFAVSSPVEAGFGQHGGSSGYVAGYGSSGGYYGGSSGGGSSGGGSSGGGSTGGGSSGGYVGPLRRLGAHIADHYQAKVARRSAYGSSGGSSGGIYSSSYGSSGGSSGGYVTRSTGSSGGGSSGGAYYGSSYSAGGSTGSYAPASSGGNVGTMHYGNHERNSSGVSMMDSGYAADSIVSPEYSSSFAQTSNKLASSPSIQSTEVYLTVNLPENAKVFVNGNPTTTTGSKRHFVSRDLKPNETYRFEVKAVVTNEDGSEVVQNKTVVVASGNGEELNFEMLQADDPIETILTLNVPEKARVVLAQNATKSEGASRVFRTKQLHDGESWDDYKIEVTFEGVTREKTIRLIAGDKLELTFNFETADSVNKVAMN